VARFCQAFMSELYRHIGQFTDVPAGDIGVGGREIGYLYGQYRRLANQFAGAMTGKGVDWGGSWLRPEATGYGTVYFAEEMLATQDESLAGRTCLVSGSGNVAQFTVEKLVQLGARPVTMSDSGGYVHDPDGFDLDKVEFVKELKNVRRGRIHEYVDAFPRATFHPTELTDHNPMWAIPAECAFPSATENEIAEKDAISMVHNGIELVAEGANMPTTSDAVRRLTGAGVLFGPAKAANAGGVAVSGLEMSQDSLRLLWTREEVDERLRSIMRSIHTTVLDTAADYDRPGDYVFGANAAGFEKVAGAMLAQGVS
jgi:glutamate dehydrogenase (NADP+)